MSATEQDRERARDLLFPELADEMPHNIARLQFSDESTGQMDRIAAALADERDRALAQFEQIADEMHEFADRRWPSTQAAIDYFENRIRRAAEESQ